MTSFACSCKVWPNWVFTCPLRVVAAAHRMPGVRARSSPRMGTDLGDRLPDSRTKALFPEDLILQSFLWMLQPRPSHRRPIRRNGCGSTSTLVSVRSSPSSSPWVSSTRPAPCRSSIGPRRALPRRPPHSPPRPPGSASCTRWPLKTKKLRRKIFRRTFYTFQTFEKTRKNMIKQKHTQITKKASVCLRARARGRSGI